MSQPLAFDVLLRDRASGGLTKIGSTATAVTGKLDRLGDIGERSARKHTKAIESTGRAFGSVSARFGHFNLGMGKVVKGAGAGVAAAGLLGVGIISLGKRLYDSASNMELMDRKARVVFGQSFPQVQKWAKSVGGQMGMTSHEVIALTASFSDMLVPMGISRDRAAKMAQKFAGLAPVLSQWSAGQFDVQQTSEALMGALTGEYDTLQRLGIPISAAKVDAEVLAQKKRGLKFATEDEAKAAAALSLVYAGSADAQAAFASGQDTLAAKSAKAKAKFGEVRDAIVTALIPVLSKVGTWFVDHQDDVVNFAFHAAAGLVTFGEHAGLVFASVVDGLGDTMIGLGNFLRTSNATWAGILTGATIALGAIFPQMKQGLRDGVAAFERFRKGAGDDLVAAGQKSKDFAATMRRNIPPAADAARIKLEQIRRAALNIPDKTLTELDVEEKAAQAKITATKRQLQDPELTKTRKAKLQADLAKWEAQKKQIQRDKANLARAVWVPLVPNARPGNDLRVGTERDRSGSIVRVFFRSGRQAFAGGGPVHGPGTATSDSILAFLSNQEHVWSAREVTGAGGHGNVARMRKLAAAGKLPGFAFGGPVDRRFDVPHFTAGAQGMMSAGLQAAVRDAARRLVIEDGGLGGGAVSGWRNQMAVLRRAFAGLALISGFRPGAITATGNRSYHALGRAVDVPPRMDVFNWIAARYGARTKELIFSPAGGRQIWNGRRHLYGEPTRGDHWDHVHWAMDSGGLLLPGQSAVNVRGGRERVLNAQQNREWERRGGGGIDYGKLGNAVADALLARGMTAEGIGRAVGAVMGRAVVDGIRANNVAVGRTADLYVRGG